MVVNPTKPKFNGLFLINKEQGVTSHDVVFSLRKILKDKQIGHIGTLDPMATGLLVCLVGESVKLSDYLMGSDKKYGLTLKLGIETDSWDITGNVLKTSDEIVSERQIESAIQKFSGNQNLSIPMFSAKKINGQKLYEIARKDNDMESFEGPLKEMKFWDLKIHEIKFPLVRLEFWCSKGAFVRSWAYSLGKKLGVGAVLAQLERQAIGEYSLGSATTLNQLRSMDLDKVKDAGFFLNGWQALQTRSVLELEALENEQLKSGLVSYRLSNRIRELGLMNHVFCFFNKQLVGILWVSDVIEVKRVFVNSVD